MPSDKTNATRKNGNLIYVTTATPRGDERFIAPRDMIHVPGLNFDGITGLSPIGLAKQTIGAALATEKFGAQFFGNGAKPSGILTAGGQLKPEQREAMRQSFQSSTSGANAQRPVLLENGVTWQALSIPQNDAQFIDTQKLSVSQLARIYGVPLHLVQDLERATNNNIEQQALEFVMYCLRPWAVRWEQELNRKLFSGTDCFVEHSMEGLLRGDFKSRMEGYQALFNIGAISVNDIRELENWNPIAVEEGGDLHFVPMNMVTLEGAYNNLMEPQPDPAAGDLGDGGTPDDPTDPATDNADGNTPSDPNQALRRDRVLAACRPLFQDAVGRIASREKRDVAAVKRVVLPVLSTCAHLIAMSAVGVAEVPAQCEEFIGGLAANLATDAPNWNVGARDAFAERALQYSFRELDRHMGGR